MDLTEIIIKNDEFCIYKSVIVNIQFKLSKLHEIFIYVYTHSKILGFDKRNAAEPFKH